MACPRASPNCVMQNLSVDISLSHALRFRPYSREFRLPHRSQSGSGNPYGRHYVVCGKTDISLSSHVKLLANDTFCTSPHSIVSLLKSCTELKDLDNGLVVHGDITRNGFLAGNPFIGCSLVSMYIKCGCVQSAKCVFKLISDRDLVLWTALITGYAQQGYDDEALNAFEVMQREGVAPDGFVYACILKTCSKIRNLDKGRGVHSLTVRDGSIENDLFIVSALIDMLVKCGALAEAHDVFRKQPVHNVVTWTALIAGFVEHGCYEEAVHHLEHMQHNGILPTTITYICRFKTFGVLGALDRGREGHIEIVKKGLDGDVLVGNILIDMYSRCGSIVEAQNVFDKLVIRNIVSFNTLIAAYVEQGRGGEALQYLEIMQNEHISPNATTLTCCVKACGSSGAVDEGRRLHNQIIQKGVLELDSFIGNVLVDMYAKFHFLEETQGVFDKLYVHDVVSWTALITGYFEYGDETETLRYFEQMKEEGIPPGAVTYVTGLKACGNLGAIKKGQEMHSEIASKGWEQDTVIGNTLVSMYVKCGLVVAADNVFHGLKIRDVVSCNALMTGFSHIGQSQSIFGIIEKMETEGIQPDDTTLICVINAFSHAGLPVKGQMYVESISKGYSFTQTLDHYNCAVDLLARAGDTDGAMTIIEEMPFHPGVLIWHTLLGACRKWGNIRLGRYAFDQAVQLDELDDAAYLCMFNIYSDVDMIDEANDIERMRVLKQGYTNVTLHNANR